MRLPQGPARRTEAIAFSGGLDEVTPPMQTPPGRLLECSNWDIPATGGYRRIPGYERYDGSPSPASASAALIQATTTFAGTLAVGDSINGATSGSTGVVAYIASDRTYIAVTKTTGPFTVGENIREGATVVGVMVAFTLTVSGAAMNAIGSAAAAIYRTDIDKPAGSGAIRGVWQFDGDEYCWRDNAGGTAGVMFKATSSGWAAVTLAEEITFTNGNVDVAVGDTLIVGAVTATIRKVIVQTGTLLSGTNTGKLVISGRAGGNFVGGAATTSGAGTLTLGGAEVAQAFPLGGKYRFINFNFGGGATSQCMYGVNGVGRAFEFDGTYLTFVDTGMAVDTPSHIAQFKMHLCLSFGASLQHAAPGTPFVWSAVLGAAELGAGDTITNLVETTDALLVFCRNKTLGLFGSGVSGSNPWTFPPLTPKIGAREDTVQIVSQPVYLDDLGVTTLAASQQYGNFAGTQVSDVVKRFINDRINTASCSVVSRQDAQYQLFFTDGTGLRLTFAGAKLIGAMPFFFPMVANVACEGEDDGILLVGGTDGYVYRLNVGRSFDGASISHRLRLAWSFSKSPRLRKRYLGTIFDIFSSSYGGFNVSYLVSRNDEDADTGSASRDTIFDGGASVGWDDATAAWDVDFGFDGDSFSRCGAELDVRGTDISFTLSGTSDDQLAYSVSGQMVDYIPGRQERKRG